MADGEDGGGGSSACAWLTRAPLRPLLTAAPPDQHLSGTPRHLQAACFPRDWLCWRDRREHRGGDMATCPHSSQWPLRATFNCFCAVGGELGCPGFPAPVGASSSSLLLALMERWGPASPGTVPLHQPGWSKGAPEPGGEEREQPPELGCLGTAGRGASEPFQGQESIFSPFHPPCPHVRSPPAPG